MKMKMTRFLVTLGIGMMCSVSSPAQSISTNTLPIVPLTPPEYVTLNDSNVVIQAQGFGGMDFSMLTNHASLVKYCLKRVGGVQISVWGPTEVDNNSNNTRMYAYTNLDKSLDGIQTLIAPERWYLEVLSPATNYISLNVQLYDGTNINNGSQQLFYGGTAALPSMNSYGQYVLQPSDENVSMYLASTVKIRIPGSQLSSVKLITVDQYGNAYPVDMSLDGQDGFDFQSALAGNGTLVISGWVFNGSYWSWTQSAISLKDGSPVPLTWVQAQVILTSSQDIVQYKNTSDLTTFIYSWYGSGILPLEVAVFNQPATNVVLRTYTSDGQNATSFDVEEALTGNKTTYTVPLGAVGTTTGTNVWRGTYYVVPQGITITPFVSGGGKG